MKEKYSLLADEKRSPAHTLRYKYYFLIIPIFIATLLLLLVNVGIETTLRSREMRFAWSKVNYSHYEDLNEKSYFIKTEGCTIPAFDPFDQSVLPYFNLVDEIECYNVTTVPLVKSNSTSLWILEDYFINYGIQNRSLLHCCYRPFYRPSWINSSSDNRYRYENYCIHFDSVVDVHDEFIRIECKYKDMDIYKDFHSFAHIKNKTKAKTKHEKYNVLILGIDAVSRLNFYRTMPKTVKMLKDMGAVDFKGYNKVGDNTYPNLVPMLSGMDEAELNSACIIKEDPVFDNCPLIWKSFDKNGYFTAFAEDSGNIAVFNYLKKGFAETPTDYYWRTFDILAEQEIGHEKRVNTKLCLGPRMTVEALLAYTYKFAETLSNQSYFGFFWETSLTHDNLNYPLLADENYASLLSTLYEQGSLDNTVLILLSDHGIRWGEIRSTHQGRMEERLPFLFVTLPKTFKNKYSLASSILLKNAKRLTTPYDVHETLKHLLDVNTLEDEKIQATIHNGSYSISRGISLFLAVPETRTCPSAGIDPHWCTCHETRKLNVTEDIVLHVANVVVEHMNKLLSDYVQCATLNLTKILDARIAEPFNSTQVKGVSHVVHDYTVLVHTDPGGGLFEATVRHTPKRWYVAGTISRINLYGKQSYCVDNFHLKLYCYCDNPISKLNIFR